MAEIERVSPNSIKAKFRFFGRGGTLIAAFDDCRFRRTYLRQHKTLDMLSFHYETVRSDRSLVGAATLPALPAPLLPADAGEGIDNTTLLFNAAVYRACHEIALRLAKGGTRVDTRALPGDFAFRCFLTNCLIVLEDAGLAEQKAGGWTIADEFSLPP